MNVTITSDGTPRGTSVVTDDGRDISASTCRLEWHCAARDELATAVLTVIAPPVELVGKVAGWRGLEHVPTEALEAELAARADTDQES